jgi:DNA-directed RNA polymerase subunit K/omega
MRAVRPYDRRPRRSPVLLVACRTSAHRARELELEAADWLEQLAGLLARAPVRALDELAGGRLDRGRRRLT